MRSLAGRITLLYLVAGMMAMMCGEVGLILLVRNTELLARLQILNGTLFVLASAGLIYVLTSRWEVGQARRVLRAGVDPVGMAALAEGAGDAVLALDGGHTVVYGNAAAGQVFGVAAERLVGRPLEHLVAERFRGRPLQQWLAGVNNGSGSARSVRTIPGLRGDGREFAAETTVARAAVGDEVCLVLVLRDATERSRLEEGLRQSEVRYRRLADQAPPLLWMTAADGSWLDFNETCRRYLGRGDSQMRGRGWLEAVHPDDRRRVQTLWGEAVRTSQPLAIEVRLRRGDGVYRWHLARATPLRDEGAATWTGCATDIDDLKLAGERLRAGERRYLTLASISPVGIYETDGVGRLRFVNERWSSITGVRAEDARGHGWADMVHPDDRDRILEEWQRAVRDGQPFRGKYRVRLEDGRTLWVLAQAVALPEAAGQPSGHVGAITDITDMVSTERALRDSEERLRQNRTLLAKAQEMAHVGSCEANFLSGETSWSEETYRILGLPPGSSAPRCQEFLNRFVHDGDRDRVRQALERLTRHGEPADVEYRVVTPSGLVKHVHARHEPVRGEGGEVVGMVGCMADVTERVQAGRRISAQAELIEKVHDAIIIRDLENRVIFMNRAAERLYGLRAEDVMGQDVDALVFQGDARVLEEVRRATLEHGSWDGELRQRAGDGREFVVESRRTLICDADGRPQAQLAINIDVTEKKRLEAQLLRAQRLDSLGILAGGIAHDLNNMLTPVLMAARVLRKNPPEDKRQRLLAALQSAAERGSHMVSQLVTFAGGTSDRAAEAVPIPRIVAEVRSILEPALPRCVVLRDSLAPGLWPVSGDPTQLSQMLLNLCVNARDAMPHGGTLTLRAENRQLDGEAAAHDSEARPGPYVLLTVADTGTGIDPNVLDRIFDPFFTTKEPGKGTGLGLATVLGIVKRHHGFVTVGSQPGRGAQFTVYLPACPGGTEVREPEPVPEGRAGEGQLILVVDDEPALREATADALEVSGYRVLPAADGSEALTLFNHHRDQIQAVLLDMSMPGLDGAAVMRAMHEADCAVPVIASSGLRPAGRSAEAIAACARAFLQKPYTDRQLLAVLGQVLAGGQPGRLDGTGSAAAGAGSRLAGPASG